MLLIGKEVFKLPSESLEETRLLYVKKSAKLLSKASARGGGRPVTANRRGGPVVAARGGRRPVAGSRPPGGIRPVL